MGHRASGWVRHRGTGPRSRRSCKTGRGAFRGTAARTHGGPDVLLSEDTDVQQETPREQQHDDLGRHASRGWTKEPPNNHRDWRDALLLLGEKTPRLSFTEQGRPVKREVAFWQDYAAPPERDASPGRSGSPRKGDAAGPRKRSRIRERDKSFERKMQAVREANGCNPIGQRNRSLCGDPPGHYQISAGVLPLRLAEREAAPPPGRPPFFQALARRDVSRSNKGDWRWKR